MVQTALLVHVSWQLPILLCRPQHSAFHICNRLPANTERGPIASQPFNRFPCLQSRQVGNAMASSSGDSSEEDGLEDGIVEAWKVEPTTPGGSFLAKLAIGLGIAATITAISVFLNKPNTGRSAGFPVVIDASSSSAPTHSVGFTFKAFGYKIILPEYTPGWIYFWLLMAAGCGLFISEEALNIWVGISLARTLPVDGTWKSFMESFSNNASFIISTVLWVYWGVCISDMIPFYLGKLFRQTKASENVLSKIGISKERALSVTQAIQKYGNLIGIVERFSLGVRNPTSFLAGAFGISAECFFAGVCCGGLITLPIQLGVGFLLRERPLVAIASVATAVGIWTLFPYALAAATALFLYLRQRRSR